MKTIPVNNGTIEIVKWEKEDARVTYAWRFKSNNNVVACTGNRWYRTPKECEVAALKVFKGENNFKEEVFVLVGFGVGFISAIIIIYLLFSL